MNKSTMMSIVSISVIILMILIYMTLIHPPPLLAVAEPFEENAATVATRINANTSTRFATEQQQTNALKRMAATTSQLATKSHVDEAHVSVNKKASEVFDTARQTLDTTRTAILNDCLSSDITLDFAKEDDLQSRLAQLPKRDQVQNLLDDGYLKKTHLNKHMASLPNTYMSQAQLATLSNQTAASENALLDIERQLQTFQTVTLPAFDAQMRAYGERVAENNTRTRAISNTINHYYDYLPRYGKEMDDLDEGLKGHRDANDAMHTLVQANQEEIPRITELQNTATETMSRLNEKLFPEIRNTLSSYLTRTHAKFDDLLLNRTMTSSAYSYNSNVNDVVVNFNSTNAMTDPTQPMTTGVEHHYYVLADVPVMQGDNLQIVRVEGQYGGVFLTEMTDINMSLAFRGSQVSLSTPLMVKGGRDFMSVADVRVLYDANAKLFKVVLVIFPRKTYAFNMNVFASGDRIRVYTEPVPGNGNAEGGNLVFSVNDQVSTGKTHDPMRPTRMQVSGSNLYGANAEPILSISSDHKTLAFPSKDTTLSFGNRFHVEPSNTQDKMPTLRMGDDAAMYHDTVADNLVIEPGRHANATFLPINQRMDIGTEFRTGETLSISGRTKLTDADSRIHVLGDLYYRGERVQNPGSKGDVGPLQGDRGPKGNKGDPVNVQEKPIIGDRGSVGDVEKGLKGDNGKDDAVDAEGDKGDKGDKGNFIYENEYRTLSNVDVFASVYTGDPGDPDLGTLDIPIDEGYAVFSTSSEHTTFPINGPLKQDATWNHASHEGTVWSAVDQSFVTTDPNVVFKKPLSMYSNESLRVSASGIIGASVHAPNVNANEIRIGNGLVITTIDGNNKVILKKGNTTIGCVPNCLSSDPTAAPPVPKWVNKNKFVPIWRLYANKRMSDGARGVHWIEEGSPFFKYDYDAMLSLHFYCHTTGYIGIRDVLSDDLMQAKVYELIPVGNGFNETSITSNNYKRVELSASQLGSNHLLPKPWSLREQKQENRSMVFQATAGKSYRITFFCKDGGGRGWVKFLDPNWYANATSIAGKAVNAFSSSVYYENIATTNKGSADPLFGNGSGERGW